MSTNALRQARLRAAREAAGLVQLVMWVPASAVADFQLAAEAVRADPDLSVARLVSKTSGKLTGLSGAGGRGRGRGRASEHAREGV